MSVRAARRTRPSARGAPVPAGTRAEGPAPTGTPRASRCEMTQVVLPGDANAHGSAFGGRILSWIDVCAAVAAHRHSRGGVVTASMDEVHFLAPVRLGDVVVLQSQVNYASRTSMEVGVRVLVEDLRSGRRRQTATAYVTFVAVDGRGRPRPVPPVRPETPEERARQRAAAERRERRLARRRELLARRGR